MSSKPFRRILIGMIVFLAICISAVAGYVGYGWDVSDALYMVVITIFGVGYGEVKPIETPELRLLTIAVIVFGYGAAVYTVGGFIQLLIDGELQEILRSRKMSQGIAGLKVHTIVCGFGRMGSIVAEELLRSEHPFLVIDQDESRVDEAHQAGMLAMVGNASDEDTLNEAGIDRAKTLATLLPDDAANAFICVTARDLNRSVEIISRGESRSAEKKLRRCGADHVIMAASVGAKRAFQLITRPTAASLLQTDGASGDINGELSAVGLQMEELKITAGSPMIGHTLSEIEIRGNRGFLIVALRKSDGNVEMNPSGQCSLSDGDVVIVVGHRDDIAALCRVHTLKRQAMTYRGAKH
ncbi:Inner membrane protein YbaL [Crateriforma conspicua]|uniref:Inner membrane protein YbaL n=1 Tax=Crateriforma conspicua TaxID=2527996 RepID=A0A5C6FPH1_9PLAN|nr:potassium channel protein [Crateriforma conspicua]TWU65012.1 Inner membrane protein YbaL [Crateriforma conspicua]